MSTENYNAEFDNDGGDSDKSHRGTIVQSSYQLSIASLKLNLNSFFYAHNLYLYNLHFLIGNWKNEAYCSMANAT